MDFKDIFTLMAVAISIGSFIIAMLSFKRNKRFENENHLYKIKMEKYHLILLEISELLQSFETKLDLADFVKEEPNSENIAALEVAAQEIDDQVTKFSFFISVHSLTFPSNVLKELEQFSDYINKQDIEEGATEKQEEIINLCFDMADKIQSTMREDLNTDVLNFSLFKRIKK